MVEAGAHPRFLQIRKGRPARRLITRPPDFEIFRHPLIVHTFFYFASLDLEKNLEIIAKFEMRNTMTQLHTVFYRAFNWLTNKK